MSFEVEYNYSEVIPGLIVIKGFTFKSKLLDEIEIGPWKNVGRGKRSRKVQHYGYDYDYSSKKVTSNENKLTPSLERLKFYLEQICSQLNLDTKEFNQCIINNYEIGQGIGEHTDAKVFGPVIGCYCFNSGSLIRFRNNQDVVKKVYLEPNTLYLLTGEARYDWSHEIPGNKYDLVNGQKKERQRRISITFRSV